MGPGAGSNPGSREPEIASDTRLSGIIGHPVAHSLSPAMHNAAYSALALRWVYLAFDVRTENLAQAIRGARALGVRALNVTAPHKAQAAGLVDRLDGKAAEIQLVNTIVFAETETVGHSTDGEGFLSACEDMDWSPAPGRQAVVVGPGGGGVSVAHALLGCGVRVVLAGRDQGRLARSAARLVRAVSGRGSLATIPLADRQLPEEMAAADLLVSAVPPSAELGIDLAPLPSRARVFDLAYDPEVTPLVAAARARGLRAANGLGMLVHQGAASFALWTGQEAPRAVMASAVGYRAGMA